MTTRAFTVCTKEHSQGRFSFLAGAANSETTTTDRRTRTTKSNWFTCSTTKELIIAIETLVEPHHKVAELGSQQVPLVRQTIQSITKGTSTHVSVIRQPQESTDSDILGSRIEISCLDDWRNAFVGDFDVLVLDLNGIGGNDLHWSSLSIIQEFTHRYNAEIVLVKSESLNQLASRLIHAERWNNIPAPNILATNDSKSPKIIASVGVDQYRATIRRTVRPGDRVLELGCHLGTTTDLLHKAASHAVGVDIGRKIIASARKRFPDVPFVVGDAWQTGRLLQLNSSSGFDVIYVDVGGLSGADGLLEALFLLSSLMYALEPRCIVIKSLCMRRLSSKLIPFWRMSKHLHTNKALD